MKRPSQKFLGLTPAPAASPAPAEAPAVEPGVPTPRPYAARWNVMDSAGRCLTIIGADNAEHGLARYLTERRGETGHTITPTSESMFQVTGAGAAGSAFQVHLYD